MFIASFQEPGDEPEDIEVTPTAHLGSLIQEPQTPSRRLPRRLRSSKTTTKSDEKVAKTWISHGLHYDFQPAQGAADVLPASFDAISFLAKSEKLEEAASQAEAEAVQAEAKDFRLDSRRFRVQRKAKAWESEQKECL